MRNLGRFGLIEELTSLVRHRIDARRRRVIVGASASVSVSDRLPYTEHDSADTARRKFARAVNLPAALACLASGAVLLTERSPASRGDVRLSLHTSNRARVCRVVAKDEC
ncbi:hypothetical protein MRX96_030358 [Rhipicephalus microplus]